MPPSVTYVPLERLIALFGGLFVTGTILTLPLYRFNVRRLVRSTLFIKILVWIPIFVVFVGFLYASGHERFVGLLLLIGIAELELVKAVGKHHHAVREATLYGLLFCAALLHFYALASLGSLGLIHVLIIIGFASVLADVAAFFVGNYLGKHKLPKVINNNKSWEGVAGQFIGAGIGVLAVNAFVEPVALHWIWLPIGLGSALGDLLNSYVKRRMGVKDWSHALPGHGGYLDRLSSLAGSALCTYFFLRFIGS